MQGVESVYFRKDPKPIKSASKKTKKLERLNLDTELEKELFLKLKAKRLELAKEENVPPYIIFHDKTLIEMVKTQPRNLDEMSLVSGVGEKKLKRYAESFLSLLS